MAEIVGVFLGSLQNGILDIYIDYTTKEYRDFSVGQALFDNIAKDSSVKQLIFKQKSTNHAKYLLSMGFKKEGDTFSKENKLR